MSNTSPYFDVCGYKVVSERMHQKTSHVQAIVEVRVSILNADSHVKPEMTASVTFQELSARKADASASQAPAAPIVLVPKRAVSGQGGQAAVWVVSGALASRRAIALGADRIDQVEVRSGLAPGETVILNAPAGLTDRARVRIKGS